jgi:probable rRNA maturation factor
MAAPRRTQARSPKSLAAWQELAERRLGRALAKIRSLPRLKPKAPQAKIWRAEVRLVGQAPMIRLNSKYRGKRAPTDVLSFVAPKPFLKQGVLGELVICLPVMKKQARQQGHSAEDELKILLIHGLLHLLGFDHEKGSAQARKMARWERKLLPKRLSQGLIGRFE